MPIIKVKLQTAVRRTFRVEQVAGMFDVPIEKRLRHELVAEVPGLDESWTIGAIVGPSGSGKTTLARAAFGDAIYRRAKWPRDRAIIDVLGKLGADGGTERRSDREKKLCHSASHSLCLTIKDLTRVLTAVGLGSPPTWLKPYQVLSGGEKFRADVARAVIGSRFKVQSSKSRDGGQLTVESRGAVLVMDEFSALLDRTVAKTASAALARWLRRQGEGDGEQATEANGSARGSCRPAAIASPTRLPRLVAVTCHEDVLPWLSPDWVVRLGRGISVQGSGFSKDGVTERRRDGGKTSSSLRRSVSPSLCHGCLIRGRPRRAAFRFRIERVPQMLWWQFEPHHYLSGGLAASASCYAAMWNKEPIGFCAVVACLGWKQAKRIQRLVVLPEFQGMGIGGKLLDLVAADQAARGFRVTITASHPAVLAHCGRSERWRYVEMKPLGSTPQVMEGREVASSVGRAVAAFEFVASPRSNVRGLRSN